ncbi:hypothetical protein JCM11957_16020 [Caminibacter profundus]
MIKKINILFLSAFIFIFLLFFWIDFKISQKNQKLIFNQYLSIAKEFLPLIADEKISILKKKAKEYNIQILKEISAKPVFTKKITFGKIEILKSNSYYYLKIRYLNDKFILFLKNQNIHEKTVLYMFLLGVIFILILIYLLILKLLKPLKELSNNFQEISKGNYQINMKLKGEKELRQLAESFNLMAKEVNLSIKEREDFIKYIGHELKTPIAKLKFAIEKKDIEKIKILTSNIEELINELIFIHLITKENMKITTFKVSTLITEAISKLFIEEEQVEIELIDFDIRGDLNYLSIALKNLIDNAIKFTRKYPIKIIAKENYIEVCSFGEKIEQSLDELTKLFVKKSKGFGIGLNIVKRIVDLHKFEFRYSYKDSKNCFKIIIKKL